MIEQPDKERWKDVVGYEGLYQVSNLGRVKSVDRLTTDKNGRTYTVKGKILNQSKVGDYLRVSLYTNNVARGNLTLSFCLYCKYFTYTSKNNLFTML